jgi:hypothetical protein
MRRHGDLTDWQIDRLYVADRSEWAAGADAERDIGIVRLFVHALVHEHVLTVERDAARAACRVDLIQIVAEDELHSLDRQPSAHGGDSSRKAVLQRDLIVASRHPASAR